MNINIKAEKFNLDDDRRAFIDKKLERLGYAEDLLTDLLLNIKLDKRNFYFDCTVNFRWGGNGHVSVDDFDFNAGMNRLIDVLDLKVKKEKDKIQEKK